MTDPATTYVLDAGALIALERADVAMTAILERVRAGGAVLVVSEAVVAQVWRTGSGRQARLAAVLQFKADRCRAVPVDRDEAEAIGRCIAETGHADVVDIHVALLARRYGAAVVTTDRDDLLLLPRSWPLASWTSDDLGRHSSRRPHAATTTLRPI